MVSAVAFGSLALFLISGVFAAPWDRTVRQSTHYVHSVGPRGIKRQVYHPKPVFETYGVDGVDHPLTKRGINNATSVDGAMSFLEGKLGISLDSIMYNSGSSSDLVEHKWFSQKFNGIPVANAVANVAMMNNKVVSYGCSFVKPKSIAPATPTWTKEKAIAQAESASGATYNGWPTTLEYFAQDDDHVVLTHAVQVQNNKTGEWYMMYVDGASGKVVNTVSYVAYENFKVVPFKDQAVKNGNTTVVKNPEDKVASPAGWQEGEQDRARGELLQTEGNNVVSAKLQEDGQPELSKETSQGSYAYTVNEKKDPTNPENVDAARVNAFVVANTMHDISYRYGFDEKSHNFQQNNSDKGGREGDPVLISVQDPSGVNNANFATPGDGQPGIMRMFIFDQTKPRRDGALENDIVTHEYTHGISNRLTGGGTGRCLNTEESAGLGEGWSDAFADWSEQKNKENALRDFTMGSHVSGRKNGIRSHPYSTSKEVNPLTYASLAERNEVHAIGEVWAEMWHEIYAGLITKNGFAENVTDVGSNAGNIVAMHLFIDGLKLQPCNPTFIQARDAIIQADKTRYKGSHECILQTAFAKRGLGTGATDERVDNNDVSPACEKGQ